MTAPTLTETRIESMRSTVMQAVDQDITRRGKRARRGVGLLTATVLVLGTGSLGLSMLDGSGGTPSGADSSQSYSGARDSSGINAMQGSAADEAPKAAAEADRQVITTGEINVTVKDPRATAQKVSIWVESIGGRIDSRTENGAGKNASAFVTVRVPSDKVTTTVERLKTYGTVNDVTLHNDDVTTQTKDLDARINALQLSITRLEKIMESSPTSADLIKAETALTQRQEQLESLQAQRNGLADQVSLSTLSIDFSQRPHVGSVEPGGFRGGLRDGWNALVSSINNLVEVIGVLLPWAAVVAVGYGAYRLIRRRRGWN